MLFCFCFVLNEKKVTLSFTIYCNFQFEVCFSFMRILISTWHYMELSFFFCWYCYLCNSKRDDSINWQLNKETLRGNGSHSHLTSQHRWRQYNVMRKKIFAMHAISFTFCIFFLYRTHINIRVHILDIHSILIRAIGKYYYYPALMIKL